MAQYSHFNHKSIRRFIKKWIITLKGVNGLMSEIYKIALALLKISTVIVALTHAVR